MQDLSQRPVPAVVRRKHVNACPELAGVMPERRVVRPAAPLAVKAEVKADAVSR